MKWPLSRIAALVLAAAALAGAGPAALAQSRDWNTTFAATETGHRVGNPAAASNVVAFISYTCPHCAAFEKESDVALQVGYIRSGKVSLEVRNLIRNPIDLAAALVADCGPADTYFARHRAILRAQDRWMKVAVAATPAQQQRWSTGAIGARMRAIASDLDFYKLLEPQGLSAAQIDRCLSDEAKARALASQSQAQSERYAIPGTPSFLLNGTLLKGVSTWATLQKALDAAS